VSRIEILDRADRSSARLRKIVFAAVTGALWAALHYGVAEHVLHRGIDRPLCVLVGDGGILAAFAVMVFAALGAFCGARLDQREGFPGMLAVAVALAVWAYPGGTMDDWLKNMNTAVRPPTAAAYAALIPEYICWAIIFAASYFAAGGRLAKIRDGQTNPRDGLTALLVTVAVAAILIMLLSGPRISHTYHGQVYFSVAASFILAVMAARRVSGVREPFWYLPAPVIVGLVGIGYAMAKPGLGVAFADINVIPANGLIRALPIEMSAVGVAAILFSLRTLNRISSDVDQNA